jgi:surface antigen
MMFNAKALVAKSLTVVGKSLIPLIISVNVFAQEAAEPKFFEYRSNSFINRLVEFSFGWFKTLDDEQNEAYHSSIDHAVMFAENGQRVSWYKNNASGYAVPVLTWQRGGGYCRHMHIQAIAYDVEKTMSATACFDDINNRWQWHNDKY